MTRRGRRTFSWALSATINSSARSTVSGLVAAPEARIARFIN